jgi:methylated-DNA-[protein]-cysteine S-methyltransferase
MRYKAYLDSPLGCWEIQGSELGLRSVRLLESPDGDIAAGDTPPFLREAVQQLREYFDSKRQDFELKLDFGAAPDFYQAVWRELLRIPYGQTTSYLAIARALGKPGAVRAVGQANAHNPLAIIVPCHRCIAKSGELQGYFYGLGLKRALLELENKNSFSRQGSLFE